MVADGPGDAVSLVTAPTWEGGIAVTVLGYGAGIEPPEAPEPAIAATDPPAAHGAPGIAWATSRPSSRAG